MEIEYYRIEQACENKGRGRDIDISRTRDLLHTIIYAACVFVAAIYILADICVGNHDKQVKMMDKF